MQLSISVCLICNVFYVKLRLAVTCLTPVAQARWGGTSDPANSGVRDTLYEVGKYNVNNMVGNNA